MDKLINKKTYIGLTFNATFIGNYNEDTNTLDNVYSVNIDNQKQAIEIAPPFHPAFLIKKFNNKEFIEIDIDLSKFLAVIDPDKIETGHGIVGSYKEITTGLIIDTAKVKAQPKLSPEEISSRLKKATENVGGRSNNGGIIH